ncbi:uncharacterized protein STEHIDRAFT_90800 [Stereum hirsutum FP-91666 SS1]|uniref:uncharacterized protein n=1 Tax=Stereum hirsutum (strain FP-91666) TaxID=721885 RepID=UPI0004409FDF|nr:uncharacterized protein STEHIDRAFT_90800 [Stereum hirsutum FP-91666 SS1]EIM90891.1 hypothetical protein STEHIDRAFT_90800 [Stereum hirsutum FP-91666 SS1]
MFPRGISTAAPSFGFARPLITYSERARSVASNGIVVIRRGIRSSSEGLPVPPPLQSLVTSQETQAARGWLEKFKGITIPKDVVEVTFSRSSGPGGQNVNKVNTKATLRCPLDALWIPPWAKDGLRRSPHFVSSSHSLLITSTTTRSQSQNVDDCLLKLHNLIVSMAASSIQNEPTEQQKDRVRGLERADKARRRADKDKRSQVKRNRSGRDWD